MVPAASGPEEWWGLVSHFTSRRDDVGFAELKRWLTETPPDGREILVPAELADDLGTMLDLPAWGAKVRALPRDQIIPAIHQQGQAFGLLPLAAIDFRVRTLAVDGVFPWDRNTDLSRYPLRLRLPRSSARAPAAFDPEQRLKVTAAGEIILARETLLKVREKGDYLYPFRAIGDLTRSANITFATLEAPLTATRELCSRPCFTFGGDPEAVDGITWAGIDVLTLADNHIGDYGARGLLDTLDLLDQKQIARTGAGRNFDEAHRAAIVTSHSKRFGFLGYNEIPPYTYSAGPSRPGSAWADPAQIEADVRALRPQVDVVVVGFHWGIEYQAEPTERQIELAHLTLDAGADVVIGDHPHWVQAIEFYKGKYITYGVGNFVFDQMWSEETRQGSLHELYYLGTKLVSVRIVPFLIEDYAQPRPLPPDHPVYGQILDRIFQASAPEFH